jgi:hypothetical protein
MPADDTEKEVRTSKNPNGPFNHQRFFSLAELNAAIRDLVVQINGRMTRHLGRSRRGLFTEIERPALNSGSCASRPRREASSVNGSSPHLGVWHRSGSGMPRRHPERLAELPS